MHIWTMDPYGPAIELSLHKPNAHVQIWKLCGLSLKSGMPERSRARVKHPILLYVLCTEETERRSRGLLSYLLPWKMRRRTDPSKRVSSKRVVYLLCALKRFRATGIV